MHICVSNVSTFIETPKSECSHFQLKTCFIIITATAPDLWTDKVSKNISWFQFNLKKSWKQHKTKLIILIVIQKFFYSLFQHLIEMEKKNGFINTNESYPIHLRKYLLKSVFIVAFAPNWATIMEVVPKSMWTIINHHKGLIWIHH